MLQMQYVAFDNVNKSGNIRGPLRQRSREVIQLVVIVVLMERIVNKDLFVCASALVLFPLFAPLPGLSQTSPTPSQSQDRATVRDQKQTQERIFGSQLMTEEERKEHREQMRRAKSDQERAEIRAQHHERMKARAEQRGVSLPDEPPVRGRGYGGSAPAGTPGGGGLSGGSTGGGGTGGKAR